MEKWNKIINLKKILFYLNIKNIFYYNKLLIIIYVIIQKLYINLYKLVDKFLFVFIFYLNFNNYLLQNYNYFNLF